MSYTNIYTDTCFEGYQKTLVTAKLVVDKHPDSFKLLPRKTKASIDIPKEFDAPDLLFVKFVFCSEHENNNGDYFARSELLKAFATPRHKPFNVEHMVEEDGSYISKPLFNNTKNTIIGHIVDSAIAKKDGTILDDKAIAKLEIKDNPLREHDDSLDLIASAVLYKFCFPKTIADIEEASEKGDMCVSMEAWFKGFDFFVGDQIVQHTDATKHHLKDWHNGKVIAGRRVSRVLRQVLFGGVAATETPANKESVFITASIEREIYKLQKRHSELHILYQFEPSDDLVLEHKEVTKAVASLQKQFEESSNA